MTVIQQTAAYHQGFEDAKDLEPLFPDASPEYQAGWKAYWDVRALLALSDRCDYPACSCTPAQQCGVVMGSGSTTRH